MPEIDRTARRTTFFLSSLLGLALLFCSAGCGPSQPRGDGGQSSSASSSNGMPELDEATINERINDTRVREVPEETGATPPIVWNFDTDEPKEITVVDKQQNGPRATIVLDIKTSSSPGVRTPRQLSGQIRTEWKLETGWVLRRWEIVKTENISMKYKDLPRPAAENINRGGP